MKTRHRARELVLQALYEMDIRDQLSLDNFVSDSYPCLTQEEYDALEDEVKIYAALLLRGTLSNLDKINTYISEFSYNRPLNKIDVVDRNILRLSIYSLLQNEVHPHIIIDEAVKLSQDFSTEVNYKFINGILDAFQKKLNLEEKFN
ncbi:MAG: transcription antitermination factor NusB [Sphaerochaetaceae bacterium]|jgi:N utilization substance protein B|nr:transcription antitermination factor NusB [Sphaerochaetaceae bacterium]MDC7237934.1 transcription antitermination factor NusB [Sphaerochaetaceae bacterium]MDC7249609.1 transcription antitermination factor NusB [Sphaerochaetaceae bacterium]